MGVHPVYAVRGCPYTPYMVDGVSILSIISKVSRLIAAELQQVLSEAGLTERKTYSILMLFSFAYRDFSF